MPRSLVDALAGTNPQNDTQTGKGLYGNSNTKPRRPAGMLPYNTPAPGNWRGRKAMAKPGDDAFGSWDTYRQDGRSDGLSARDRPKQRT